MCKLPAAARNFLTEHYQYRYAEKQKKKKEDHIYLQERDVYKRQIVNKSCSDRVGGREDYEIFGELPEEIRADSLQIACQGEDTKVYVFEGSTVTLEKYRRELSAALGGGVLGGSIAFAAAIAVGSRKKKEDAEQ